MTNVQCELSKLKLEPHCPPAEPLRAATEDHPIPARLAGGGALFHQPWTKEQGGLGTIVEDRECSTSSSAGMTTGAFNSTAGTNSFASNSSSSVPTPVYSTKGSTFVNPFKPEVVQFMLSAVAGNPMPRVDQAPPEPLEQAHINIGMQVGVVCI